MRRRSLLPAAAALVGGVAVLAAILVGVRARNPSHAHTLLASASSQSHGFSVLTTAGVTHIRKAGQEAMQPIRFTTPVREGDLLTTGPSSYIDLMLDDRNFIRIGPNTEMTVQAEYTDPSGRAWGRIVLDVVQGRFAALLRNLSGREVHAITRTAVVGVRGTVFALQADEQATVVAVLEGIVEAATVSAPEQVVQIRPMEQAAITKDDITVNPIDEQAQSDLQAFERVQYFAGPETGEEKSATGDSQKESQTGTGARGRDQESEKDESATGSAARASQDLRRLIEFCKGEVERMAPGRCFAENTDPAFSVNDVERGQIGALFQQIRAVLGEVVLTTSNLDVNEQGEQAFATFRVKAVGRKKDNTQVSREFTVMMNFVSRDGRWMAAWLRYF